MADKVPQTKSNHVRLDPAYHFVLLPALVAMLIWTVIHLIRHLESTSAILLILVVLMIVIAIRFRPYALKVQDRVIRLEERLRLTELLPDPLRARIPELTESQLIALRFAPDAEIPTLVQRTLSENMSNKQIKEAIRNWRPDYWRA